MIAPDLTVATMSKLAGAFSGYPELSEVVLFGSRATGRASARSDIDLATRGILDRHRLGRLALDLEDLDIPQACDLVAYESVLYAPLRTHIDTVGITIYRSRLGESNAKESE